MRRCQKEKPKETKNKGGSLNKTLYINPTKKQKTLSPIGMRENNIYQAHELEDESLVPYIPKAKYDKLLKLLKESGQGDLIKEITGK